MENDLRAFNTEYGQQLLTSSLAPRLLGGLRSFIRRTAIDVGVMYCPGQRSQSTPIASPRVYISVEIVCARCNLAGCVVDRGHGRSCLHVTIDCFERQIRTDTNWCFTLFWTLRGLQKKCYKNK